MSTRVNGLILRQVDDMIITTEIMDIKDHIMNAVETKLLRITIKFYRANIEQTASYIYIYCKSYIDAMLKGNSWDKPALNEKCTPKEPLHPNSILQIETDTGPTDPDEIGTLEDSMGFSYHHVVSKLVIAIGLCHEDLRKTVMKMAKYNEHLEGS